MHGQFSIVRANTVITNKLECRLSIDNIGSDMPHRVITTDKNGCPEWNADLIPQIQNLQSQVSQLQSEISQLREIINGLLAKK